jgi:hypothetical protein
MKTGKLQLSRQTIRQLTHTELAFVDGGQGQDTIHWACVSGKRCDYFTEGQETACSHQSSCTGQPVTD